QKPYGFNKGTARSTGPCAALRAVLFEIIAASMSLRMMARRAYAIVSSLHICFARADLGAFRDPRGCPDPATCHNFGPWCILGDRQRSVTIELQRAIIGTKAVSAFSHDIEGNRMNGKTIGRDDGGPRQSFDEEAIKITAHVAQTGIHACGSAGA